MKWGSRAYSFVVRGISSRRISLPMGRSTLHPPSSTHQSFGTQSLTQDFTSYVTMMQRWYPSCLSISITNYQYFPGLLLWRRSNWMFRHLRANLQFRLPIHWLSMGGKVKSSWQTTFLEPRGRKSYIPRLSKPIFLSETKQMLIALPRVMVWTT